MRHGYGRITREAGVTRVGAFVGARQHLYSAHGDFVRDSYRLNVEVTFRLRGGYANMGKPAYGPCTVYLCD